MKLLREELEQSLKTGFIDKKIPSNVYYLPQILINDKTSAKKVLTTIENELKDCDEFWFSVAFITTSGTAVLKNKFIELRERGIKGKILVSQYLNFTQPQALRDLLQFDNIKLKIAVNGDFHSKGYLFKNKELYHLIVGSSNLTSSALSTNTELNLKISATPESHIIENTLEEFNDEFNKATSVDENFISAYEEIYTKQSNILKKLRKELSNDQINIVTPNAMQTEALANIELLRSQGKNKSLLISATGTGKTYLSAFDSKRFDPNKLLFVVHRENIAKAALKSFKKVFGKTKSMGMYTGNNKELDKDFVFSTVQTMSMNEHLAKLSPEHFNYIIIDESHRAAAGSYQRILNYFKPQYLLGMTATPERTDGLDIFKLFDHTIAYEIRLHKAMDEDMLSPFHYYGVTDITVNGKILEDNTDFALLTATERVDRIIEKIRLYGCDNGVVRGLVFCSKIEECKELSRLFNERNYKTLALVGSNTEKERSDAIDRLESDDPEDKLDYIFTVDIFNEGIDIPRVNQIIMLRPTQSAIIFVQQLGRGLRKTDNKEYLTVIDFIGNYSNNYLVPVALYGDTSYNKDTLRKLLSSGSSLIPGTSTINFDRISRERIYQSIDTANMRLKKDLVLDYKLLKYKLGRIPMMVDFIEHGSRDPYLFVNYSDSYYNFVLSQENAEISKLDTDQSILLELFSKEINNSKRIEESIILKELLDYGKLSINRFKEIILKNYNYHVSDATINSCVNNLNFKFVTKTKDGNKKSANKIYGINCISLKGNDFELEPSFKKQLNNTTFRDFLIDNTNYAIHTYNGLYDSKKFHEGFILYQKYSRKDVFRILNWQSNPVAQNVGGYIVSPDKSNFPIFVNYHKEDHISNTTKYEDGFVNKNEFNWMTKSKRKLDSPDVIVLKNYRNGLRIPLFIKKSNGEGNDFYYMGDVTPIDNSFEQTTMSDDDGNEVSVVKVRFLMNQPVDDTMYSYITNQYVGI